MRAPAYALGAVMTGLLLTGCGALGGDDGGEAGGTREPTTEEAMVDFAACMRENGFDMPDPEGDGVSIGMPAAGADDEELMAALESCEELLPVDENAPSEEEVFERHLLMAECMREEGYDMPDPEPGQAQPMPVQPDDDEGMEALTRCSDHADAEALGEGGGDS
ncbi:hypothetical protein SAMN05421803_11525 [Nocardiopsis flavescens]|uniref:Uncharacterized protein n=1 Tax=Nocardiopsis flavescens TaxID=758803 RepID=A0A1M6QE95_9ACTN|nr:hypothetical protein [Nocardiopsis flavescens]SHK18562.1 hypothetical protein SAMN05421803_11525 [Nocardiopsis flavescens]